MITTTLLLVGLAVGPGLQQFEAAPGSFLKLVDRTLMESGHDTQGNASPGEICFGDAVEAVEKVGSDGRTVVMLLNKCKP